MSIDDQFIHSLLSETESRLSMARTKSSFPAQLASQQSLQTLATFDDVKCNLRESSRLFNHINIESVDSPETSSDETIQQLENQVLRCKDTENYMNITGPSNQLRSELDQFIGLLQKVKNPEPPEPRLKTNLSVIISTDESLASKQSPAQDYYSFTNQNSRVEQQSVQDLAESRETDSFQKMVTQKSQIIHEGFKRCLKSLIAVCKQHSFIQALPWIDKLAAIQIVQMQQSQRADEQIAKLEMQVESPKQSALRECLNQQEQELELLQKQNQTLSNYQSELELEIKNMLVEQAKDRQALVDQQQKNFQLKNLILIANRQYEDLLCQLAKSEKKCAEQQAFFTQTVKHHQQANKILRNVIMATGDDKVEQMVDVLLKLINKHQAQQISQEQQLKQRSEGSTTRQKSESTGRSKENSKQRGQRINAGKNGYFAENHQKSPLSTLRNKISEFHSASKKSNRSLHLR